MKDDACICFLQWALPHLRMRWQGFRKVRGQVCKRIDRRLEELNLSDFKSYRIYLGNNPLEWHILDSMCRITISRFYRDQGVYDALRSHVFPGLIDTVCSGGTKIIACWCVGAASGEEPYSVSLLWELAGIEKKGTDLRILATEIDQHMINRARNGCYPASSFRELPPELGCGAFTLKGRRFCLDERYKKRVRFVQQDIRSEQPDASFHLILCRNLVFTYFARDLQEEIAQKIYTRLKPGGVLVTGNHEVLPAALQSLLIPVQGRSIYRRAV